MAAKEAREAIEGILNYVVLWRGKTQSVAAWIAEYGADQGLVLLRLTAGWSIDRAIQEPVRQPHRWTTKPTSSRFRGVTRHGSRKDRWYARISNKGELLDLGTSEDECEAAALYNIAARNRDGLAAKVNLM